jgi:hypothetical protein
VVGACVCIFLGMGISTNAVSFKLFFDISPSNWKLLSRKNPATHFFPSQLPLFCTGVLIVLLSFAHLTPTIVACDTNQEGFHFLL